MAYQVGWYIEGQVIYLEIWGEQTVEELVEANTTMIEKLDSVDKRLIHILINDEKLEKIPVSLTKLQTILTYSKHSNLGWAVLYGNKQSLMKNVQDFLMAMLAKIARARYIRVKTFDEAIDHLRKVDQTLDWDAVKEEVSVKK